MSNTIFKTGLLAAAVLVAAFKLAIPEKVNVVFIGDSITYGSNQAELQPSVYALDYLTNKFKGTKFNQANRGVSGFTTLNFLPGQPDFAKVIANADDFAKDTDAQLLFSIMLGTNDSAIQGPYGSPVSPSQYAANLKTITDTLLKRYPNSKVVYNNPIYYSPNTYNGAKYLQEGQDRLQSYFPQIEALVIAYKATQPNHVYAGYTKGFEDFKKNYLNALQPEPGKQGTFYLHPNKVGAKYLGVKWGEAIAAVLSK